MAKWDVASILRQLQNELDQLKATIDARLEESETSSIDALSAYDNHPADLGTETFEREMDVGLTTNFTRRIEIIERAQQKMAEGSYGICDRCHRPIERLRLKAQPSAIYCMACQEIVESLYVPTPPEEEVVPMPYGDAHDLGRNIVEADGEDMWQSVARWGDSNTPQDTPPAVDYAETYVGFEEPIGYVEEVESIVDEQGDVLWDALREKARKQAQSTAAESDEYPEK
ncbi:MAG: TraR/DksA C4-type zinc finger protein, partial [Firmicutes bacterium]|nr:TraR/DksA C4-type zinc finger protein [Bacillota bacterium]